MNTQNEGDLSAVSVPDNNEDTDTNSHTSVTNGTQNNNSNSTTQEHIESYPSISLILDITRNEYTIERERTNNLDNKANIFISIIIALITVYIPMIPIVQIKQLYQFPYNNKTILCTGIICIMLIALLSLIMSFLNLFNTISLKPFKRVNFENLNDEKVLKSPTTKIERGMVEHFYTILCDNARINDAKANKLRCGIKYCIIFFCLLSLATISLIIITS